MMHRQIAATGIQKLRHLRHVRRAGERGFGMFSAIFLLVMLSSLGAVLMSVSSSSQIAIAIDIQGERAYQSARAGIEWGLYQQLRNNSCLPSTSFAMPAGITLSSFTVTVTCEVTRTPQESDPVPSDGSQKARASPLNGSALKQISGTLTAGSSTVTVTGIADTKVLADGMIVRGTGIPNGARILNVINSTTVMLTVAATTSGNSADMTYQSDMDGYALNSTACNQPAGGACPHAATSNNPDYVQRVLGVRF